MRRRLQTLRIIVAVGVGSLFLVAFLGPAGSVFSLAAWLPWTQVGPALYQWLGISSLAAGLVLAVVALVTLVVGRVYCAACCPLGILQDVLRFLARRLPALCRLQERAATALARQSRPRWLTRWVVLAATVVLAALGCVSLASVLEPYSAYGRIVTQLGGPLWHEVVGALSAVLERFDVYALAPGRLPVTSTPVLLCTLAFLLLLAALVAVGGRVYCTTLCPVGTCLGLLAQAAPVRVRFAPGACLHCGVCARRCRAGCIEVGADGVRVDQAACVACMECLTVCPAAGVRYGLPERAASAADLSAPVDCAGRRELLAAGLVASGAAVARLTGSHGLSSRTDDATGGPVAAPGSGNRERFVQSCTACQLCVTVCPTRVLKPALFEYGAAGFLQPRLSFRDSFCEYDCNRCTTICPTGALRALPLDEKQRTQLGVARLYADRCIVYCRGEECGACAEVCPTHAVYTVERDGLLYPEMAAGACIGCGACEYACPVDPRAIEVVANVVHGRAAPPYVPETPALPADGTAPPVATPTSAEFPF